MIWPDEVPAEVQQQAPQQPVAAPKGEPRLRLVAAPAESSTEGSASARSASAPAGSAPAAVDGEALNDVPLAASTPLPSAGGAAVPAGDSVQDAPVAASAKRGAGAAGVARLPTKPRVVSGSRAADKVEAAGKDKGATKGKDSPRDPKYKAPRAQETKAKDAKDRVSGKPAGRSSRASSPGADALDGKGADYTESAEGGPVGGARAEVEPQTKRSVAPPPLVVAADEHATAAASGPHGAGVTAAPVDPRAPADAEPSLVQAEIAAKIAREDLFHDDTPAARPKVKRELPSYLRVVK